MERANKKDIPAGAVIMDRDEALHFLWDKIYNHKPVEDVIALRYGSTIAGASASLGGFVLLGHFRSQLGLRREAAISSNIACFLLPCFSTFLYHYLFITPPILLQEKYCKVCLELKAVGIQSTLGLVWPWALSMISATMTANKLGVHMPSILEPIKLIKLSWELANKGKGPAKLTGLLVLNTLGAVILVRAEEIQVLTFKRRVQIRRELDDD